MLPLPTLWVATVAQRITHATRHVTLAILSCEKNRAKISQCLCGEAGLAGTARTRQRHNTIHTRCHFNVRSKADISQLNVPHGNNN